MKKGTERKKYHPARILLKHHELLAKGSLETGIPIQKLIDEAIDNFIASDLAATVAWKRARRAERAATVKASPVKV